MLNARVIKDDIRGDQANNRIRNTDREKRGAEKYNRFRAEQSCLYPKRQG